MKKKLIRIMFSVFLVILTVPIGCAVYVIHGTDTRKSYVLEYLEKMGYSSSEIHEVNVEHSFSEILSDDDHWRVSVIFSDEPSAHYDYICKGEANISQAGGFKWTTADDNKLKHIDINE